MTAKLPDVQVVDLRTQVIAQVQRLNSIRKIYHWKLVFYILRIARLYIQPLCPLLPKFHKPIYEPVINVFNGISTYTEVIIFPLISKLLQLTTAVNATGLKMRLYRSIPESRFGTGGKSDTWSDFEDLLPLWRGSSAFLLNERENNVFQDKKERCSGKLRGRNAVNFDLGTFPSCSNWTQQEFIHPDTLKFCTFSRPLWATLIDSLAVTIFFDSDLKINWYPIKKST